MLKIFFAGSPDLACPAFLHLAKSGKVALAGVLTMPESRVGRGGKIESTPIFKETEKLNQERQKLGLSPIPAWTPKKLDSDFCEKISALDCDLLVCFAYGKIFKPEFLAAFKFGGINFHPSLLPKFRGPSPIQAAILAGERQSGWTVQRLAEKMDAGNIILQKAFDLTADETAQSLAEKVSNQAGEALLSAILKIESGDVHETPQNDSDATYCHFFDTDAARIDWAQSAVKIDAQIRAYNPLPLAWTTLCEKRLSIIQATAADADEGQAGEPGKVLAFDKKRGILVQCGKGALYVTKLQWQSKKALDFRDFFNGNKGVIGEVCGSAQESTD